MGMTSYLSPKGNLRRDNNHQIKTSQNSIK